VDDVSSPVSYYRKSARVDALIFEKRLRWIEEVVSRGTLLDIGCNIGTFADVATRRGWKVVGVDANPHALALTKDKGHTTFQGLFDAQLIGSLEPREFDLVALGDVVEHFPNPLESLKLVRTVVKRGGYLAVNTPNFGSVVARTFQIKPKEHIFFFDERTLARTLREAGFEVVFLIKTGRQRDFASLETGATIQSPWWLAICRLLRVTGIEAIANFTLEKVVTDELFALCRKP